MKTNIRTMQFVNKDFWDRPVYKCLENNYLWKDITCGEDEPDLYSCQNEFDGEPESPIKQDLNIVYIDKYQKNKYEFEYMLLGRMKSDCDAHLGVSNRKIKNIESHIIEMKRLWNVFPESGKPDWLTYEQILEYETKMNT